MNYHYLLVEVDHQQLVTMNRLDLTSGQAVWTKPDSVQIATHSVTSAKAAGANSKAARRERPGSRIIEAGAIDLLKVARS